MTPMTNKSAIPTREEALELWAQALESGEYTQGRKVLHRLDHDTYCCLGVACDLAVREGVIEHYEPLDWYPPVEVSDWLGLRTHTGEYSDGVNSRNLVDDNDTYKHSFSQIAQTIREQFLNA